MYPFGFVALKIKKIGNDTSPISFCVLQNHLIIQKLLYSSFINSPVFLSKLLLLSKFENFLPKCFERQANIIIPTTATPAPTPKYLAAVRSCSGLHEITLPIIFTPLTFSIAAKLPPTRQITPPIEQIQMPTLLILLVSQIFSILPKQTLHIIEIQKRHTLGQS